MKKNTEDTVYGSRTFGISVLAALAVVFMLLAGMCVRFTSYDPLWLSLFFSAIYIAVCASVLIILKKIRTKSAGSNVIMSVLGGVLRDTVQNMNSPVIICDEKDAKVIWHNKASSTLAENGQSVFGVRFDKLLGVAMGEVLQDESENGLNVSVAGRTMRVRGMRVRVNEKTFCIFTMTDTTELTELYKSVAKNELAVAHIIVDNLEEIRQYEQDRFRECSSQVASILSQWAQECGGILKEYERDKYLMIFTAEKLDECIAKKFDILDRVRDIHVGGGAVPITVSMGISNISGSFAERERAAANALETALQRGGDQVVVRGEAATEYYGGRTKTVQRRTKVRARVISSELLMYMSRASNVIIMGHKFADFDAFGACVGVCRLAMFAEVPVNIVTDFGDPSLDERREEFASLPEYRGVFVDSASALDLVTTQTLLIIVDVNNAALFESPELAKSCTDTVIIDHHRKTAEFEREPKIAYIEPSASAACELVAEMLEQVLPAGLNMQREAKMMLAGIILDTKQFTVNTGVRTFSAALYLRDRGANPTEALRFFKTPLEDYIREAKFRTNVVIYRSVIAIALGDGEGENADRVAAAKSADKLLSVDGVRASFALIRIGEVVHISARSTGDINVQLILEQLRGGGHYDAAGAQVEAKSVQQALEMLKGAIDAYLDEGALPVENSGQTKK